MTIEQQKSLAAIIVVKKLFDLAQGIFNRLKSLEDEGVAFDSECRYAQSDSIQLFHKAQSQQLQRLVKYFSMQKGSLSATLSAIFELYSEHKKDVRLMTKLLEASRIDEGQTEDVIEELDTEYISRINLPNEEQGIKHQENIKRITTIQLSLK